MQVRHWDVLVGKLGFGGGSAYLITVENYIFFYRNDSHKTAETMRLLTKLDEGLIYQYGYQLFCILQSAWAIFISTDDELSAYQGGS